MGQEKSQEKISFSLSKQGMNWVRKMKRIRFSMIRRLTLFWRFNTPKELSAKSMA